MARIFAATTSEDNCSNTNINGPRVVHLDGRLMGTKPASTMGEKKSHPQVREQSLSSDEQLRKEHLLEALPFVRGI